MLSRSSLSAVLQSLLGAELRAARGRKDSGVRLPPHLPPVWSGDMPLSGAIGQGLGCDSLEVLWLASAVNEMFHLHEVALEDDLMGASTFGGWLNCVEAAWERGVASVTFSTSGSTGRPKRCVHAADTLQAETEYLSDLFRGRRRIVSLVPAHHIYGFLFTAMLPERLGIEWLSSTDLGVGQLARELMPGDLVVTYPERWHWLERSLRSWPRDVEGVVSTAPCPPELIAALSRQGLTAMTEVYGSSETAGVGIRRRPDANYHLLPRWRFAEPFDPDAPEVLDGTGARVALPDRIVRHGGDCFELAGRRDGAVQVGGVNVFPEHVAALVRRQPNVRDAAVRLMREDEGVRLKAFVVPATGVDPVQLRVALTTWIGIELPAASRPTAITFGSVLPTGSMGKPLDW
jgi:long-chain acyl-CoA synthetase